MTNYSINNTRLGVFLSVGLIMLVVALYAIGKNRNLFGARIHLRARFKNVNGLMVGNNVRYSGIQAGTVNEIKVIDDTTIEVVMLIDKNMQTYLRSNAVVSIGSDGLMGNKLINIAPGSEPAGTIEDGFLLTSANQAKTDDMLATLSETNMDAQIIARNLKEMTTRLNESKALWSILNDSAIYLNLKVSVGNINKATAHINNISATIDTLVANTGRGEGIAGTLLNDKNAAADLKKAIADLSVVLAKTNNLINDADSAVVSIKRNMNTGPGLAHSILSDTVLIGRLNRSIQSVENGTAAFDENMEALKHNFLTRGYFKKRGKAVQRAAK